MPYDMHRVFFATPLELEDERKALHEIVSEFNEQVAMPAGVLLVTVSLPQTMVDKRAYQAAVLENIRDARYYVQFLEDSWGPPTRNFERDYAMARKYAAEGTHACKKTALLFKKPLLPHRVDPDVVALKQCLVGNALVEFESATDLKALIRPMLETLLRELTAATAP